MCGVCGFIGYRAEGAEGVLRRMCQSLAHRGPDGDGIFHKGVAGLGHRRLAIIDLECGEQPMRSADGRYTTVFNGEIYNYKELRAELSSAGSVFHTNSDTEVIAESIREWGLEKAASRLRGMFAFSVFDAVDNKLLIARDPFGVKPFYYAEIGGAFFFASEQKALLEVPGISRKLDRVGVHDFLTLGFPVTPSTCWKSIRLLPPGHCGTVSVDGRLDLRRYWSFERRPERMSFEDALGRAEAVLKDSLALHLRSDVPVGAFLSGGIDSSLLVSLLMDGLTSSLETFNVGFGEGGYDESAAAQEVADRCRTSHHRLIVGKGMGEPQLFEDIVSCYDEPFGDSSCLPTYLVCREMRQHVKTVISGDGGDELFGGYERFKEVRRVHAAARMGLGPLIKAVGGLLSLVPGRGDLARRLRKAGALASLPESAQYCGLHTYFTEEERSGLYRPEFLKSVEGEGPTWRRMAPSVPVSPNDPAERLIGMELAMNLHADYLRKVDIASSAHGLEVRVPILDVEVFKFASTLPMDLKIGSDGTCKLLLRELASRRISPAIGRKPKQGFGIPFDKWCGPGMMAYLRETLFDAPDGEGAWAVFDKGRLDGLWRMFSAPDDAKRSLLSRYQVYQRVFMLASLQIWFKRRKPEW